MKKQRNHEGISESPNLTEDDAIGLGWRLPDQPDRCGSDFREEDADWRARHCHAAVLQAG